MKTKILNYFIVCFVVLIVSCSEKDEPVAIAPIEDTYVITFTGDCNKFKGSVSVSTSDSNCYLNSSSFEDQSSNLLSDSQFKEVYDFTSSHYDKGMDHQVKINCSALCISEYDYSMKCNIYVMKMNGDTLMFEKEFVSYRPGANPKPTSQEYTLYLKHI